MIDFLNGLLKNFNCSNCTDNDFNDTYSKDNYKSWKLYLKEYELYSAMILYNNKLNKDISYLISKNESILLLNDNNEIYIKLEYISINDDNIPILIPTDDYQELYESIENMEKSFDKDLNAHYIGTFNIKKCK